jgi:hypothetical protein
MALNIEARLVSYQRHVIFLSTDAGQGDFKGTKCTTIDLPGQVMESSVCELETDIRRSCGLGVGEN